MKITRLAGPEGLGGENPMWDAALGVLHYIDNTGCKMRSHAGHPRNIAAAGAFWRRNMQATSRGIR